MTFTAIEARATQEHFGFESTEPVEKDWHVTRALATAVSIPNSKLSDQT
jgi:hypothetical protein